MKHSAARQVDDQASAFLEKAVPLGCVATSFSTDVLELTLVRETVTAVKSLEVSDVMLACLTKSACRASGCERPLTRFRLAPVALT